MTFMHRYRFFIIAAILVVVGGIVWHHFSCRSLACLKTHDPWVIARYNPRVPLFLKPSNDRNALNAIGDAQQRADVDATLKQLNNAADKNEAWFTKMHPRSCAVVGNADNLLSSGYGALIDGHTLVFRMNNAPIKRFETDVGRRTTFHIIHSYFESIQHYEKNTITVLISDNINKTYQEKRIPRGLPGFDDEFARDMVWLASQLSPNLAINVSNPPGVFPRNIKTFADSLRIMHPDFVYYIADRWFTPDNRWRLDLPSTGFKTIILALHLCDQVDLFGFGALNEQSRWAHYWDLASKKGVKAHRPDFQETFIAELERRGLARRYRGVEHKQPIAASTNAGKPPALLPIRSPAAPVN